MVLRKYLWSPIDHVCISPPIHVFKPNPQCNGIKRWGLWRWSYYEGGALVNGISALIKETQRAPSPFWYIRTQEFKSVTEKKVLTRPLPCWHPSLRFLVSRAVRNTLLFFRRPVYGTLLQQPKLKKMVLEKGWKLIS